MAISTKNPQTKSINQKQGPRVGNGFENGTKRADFIKEKTSGYRTELADVVMNALTARAPDDKVDPKVEGLHANTGPKRNPTAGGTEYNVRKPAPRKITK